MNTMAPIAFVERELAAGKNKIVIPKGFTAWRTAAANFSR